MFESTDYLNILVLWAQKTWPGRPQPSEVQKAPLPPADHTDPVPALTGHQGCPQENEALPPRPAWPLPALGSFPELLL